MGIQEMHELPQPVRTLPPRETFALVESIKDYAILVLDPEGQVLSWNAGARAIKGWREDEIVGQSFTRFYTEADRLARRPQRLLAEAAANGRVEEEAFRVRKDGSQFWADVVITALRDERGGLRGFVKVTRDLTERRRAEQRLEAYARQQAATAAFGVEALRTRDLPAFDDRVVHAILDVLDADLVAVLARHGEGLQVVAASGFDDGVVGRSVPLEPNTLVGRALAQREPVVVTDFEAEQELVLSPIERNHGARSGVAVVVPAPRGHQAHGVLVVLRRWPHAADEEIAFLQGLSNVIAAAVAREHDERLVRLAEQRAAEQRARSEQVQRELSIRDEFISIAAHELRTPLNALQLNLHALSHALEGATSAGRVANRIEGALRQSKRLSHLISRVLDVSRIAAGTMIIEPEPLDLARLARDVVETMRETACRAGSEVSFLARASAEGAWDRTRIEQITTNLLANAINYGGGKPIEVEVDADETHARLVVRDHGIGIAPDDLDRIFGRFERAVPVRNYGGLGLGLYIAQHIVAAHGGTIRVESELGRGACFVVELPRTPPPAPPLGA